MRSLILVFSLFVLGACAHHGGHHRGHKSKCGCKGHKAKFWEKMDANKDGKVSKDEWMKDKAEWFTKMDANKDGFVTLEEKKAYKKAMHGKKGDKKKADCKSCK